MPEFPEIPIWEEPVRGSYPDVSVLALQGDVRGTMIPPPPIHHLFGMAPVRGTEPGTSVFTMPCSPWLQSSVGVYTAGVYALAADAPFGGAIVSQLPPGVVGTTSELTMNFLRPADPASIELTARAQSIDVGRSLGLSESIVTDARGRRLAHGTSRYFLRAIEPTPTPPSDLTPPTIPSFDTPDPHARALPDGLVLGDEAKSLSGLELFTEAHTAPPFARLFGIDLVEASEGAIAFDMVASEWLTSPARTIYGGIIALLADTALTGAVTTTLPAGHSCATLDFKVNYLRPGFADGRKVTARARVVHRGRSIAVAQGELLNTDGKPMAVATGSTMVLERPWGSVAVADEAREDES